MSRSRRLPWLALLVHLLPAAAAVSAEPGAASAQGGSAKKPNILFIAVDDLNHWVGYTGRNPQTKTPNIDRLSKMGESFTHAYCAAPLCNPSRAALMSGMRPSTTGCYQNNENWKNYIPEGEGLTATFRAAGYKAMGAGKIYHGNSYYAGEWDEYRFGQGKSAKAGKAGNEEGDAESDEGPGDHGPKDVNKNEGFHKPVAHDLKDEDINDWHIASYGIDQLNKKQDKPFFLALGFHKPHLPWVVPQKYYKMFPVDSIQLPPYQKDDLNDIPPAGVKMAKPEGDHAEILKEGRWKLAIQSYLACIAYLDMNLGRVLDGLDKSPYKDNTIVVFWGDHGWHLGEKDHWRKFALWEEATRAPLIWVVPGVTQPGTLCERTVDFMSFYPTLCDLAGVAKPAHVEGENIRPLLADPKSPWDKSALSTYGYENHAVRTEAWRLIRYADGSEELYDETKDPYEWKNLAKQQDEATTIASLSEAFPKDNKKDGKTKLKGAGKK